MKSNKPPFLSSLFIAAAALVVCHTAHADRVILNSGDSIEGTIIREDDAHYYVQVQVTKSIKEEKIVPKADVKSIERESGDAKAFEPLSGLVPAPDLLEVEEYATRIATIEEFIKAHPESSLKEEAEKMVEELRGEMEIVSAGGVKMGGLVISSQDYAANAYALDEAIAAKRIESDVARRDFLGALRGFEKYQTSFSQAAGRAEVVEKIKQVLAIYGTSLRRNLESFDVRMEKSMMGLEQMAPEDRSQTQKALESQKAQIEKKYSEEKASRIKWITPDTNLKQSLTDALRAVESEAKKLESGRAAPAPEKPFEELYREAWRALDEGDDEAKAKIIDDARRARLPDAYLEKLTERAGITTN